MRIWTARPPGCRICSSASTTFASWTRRRTAPWPSARGMRLTSPEEWREGIDAYDFVVLHSGGYWRDHPDLAAVRALGVEP